MRMFSIIGLILLSILIGPVAAMATTTIIDDNDSTNGGTSYWGGLYGGGDSHVDVISGDTWAANTMVITNTGTSMTVKIYGLWFSGSSAQSYSGDLYINSTGWNVSGSGPHYASDTFTQSEGWNYVVTHPGIMDYTGTPSYTTGVYKLDFDADNFKMTFPTYTMVGGRSDQAYKGGYTDVDFVEGATVTFTIDPNNRDNSSMTFKFDTPLLQLGNNPGFHWTMYCGNDVIEGQGHTVPEPGALLLLGLGLAGLGFCRRRAN